MVDNSIATASITIQGTTVVYESSSWWADHLTITNEHDGVTVILHTDDNINLSVTGGHNVTAILRGDGRGNVVCEVYGQAVRQGSGPGDAISHGNGQAVRQGSGPGDAISHGNGQAVRQGSGDGDAISYGNGASPQVR